MIKIVVSISTQELAAAAKVLNEANTIEAAISRLSGMFGMSETEAAEIIAFTERHLKEVQHYC